MADSHTHEHTHHGHATHEHGHGHDFAAANREFFDEHAHELENVHQELAARNVKAMRDAWPGLFDEDRTTAMDYACGTGASVFSLQSAP